MEKLERIPINSGVVMLPPGRSLMVNTDLLNQAGLRGKLRVVVQPGEIRILPAVEPSAQEVLDRLAGCLGGESSTDYDFGLKIGGLTDFDRIAGLQRFWVINPPVPNSITG